MARILILFRDVLSVLLLQSQDYCICLHLLACRIKPENLHSLGAQEEVIFTVLFCFALQLQNWAKLSYRQQRSTENFITSTVQRFYA